MVLTIRSVYLRNTTSTGIAFVPLIKSEKWPIEKVQIRVSLLSATEVLTIMEDLKQYTNFYYMVRILPTSLSSNVIGFSRRGLDELLVPVDGLDALCDPFDRKEMDDIIKFMPPDKSPGPDGFNGKFLKSCWP